MLFSMGPLTPPTVKAKECYAILQIVLSPMTYIHRMDNDLDERHQITAPQDGTRKFENAELRCTKIRRCAQTHHYMQNRHFLRVPLETTGSNDTIL